MAAKKTANTESRFYIAKTVNGAKEKIEKKVKPYSEKIVNQPLENGREFFTELKTDPVRKIEALVDGSKDAFNKLKSDRIETLQKKIETTKKDALEKWGGINEKTQKIYKGIGNDAKLITADFFALGKKNLDKIPMKKTIGKKIFAGIDAIPGKLNLPSKGDIDNLVTGIDGVNKKVDALNKEYAKA
jgi:hypothetical protein